MTLFKRCSVPDCSRNAHSSASGCRGFCCSHYRRFMRHGTPLGGNATRGSCPRFLETAIKFTGGECLIWPYGGDGQGYGSIGINGKTTTAHRLVCLEVYGPPPTVKHEVAHSCGQGNKGCVNPKHLRWATHAENMSDKVAHGTSNRGNQRGNSKLSEIDIPIIRRRIATGDNRTKIALDFGVSLTAIRDVQSRRCWGWLT